jgi:membrane-associated phospholipid phosphatase
MKLAVVSLVLAALVAFLLFVPAGRAADVDGSRRALALDQSSAPLHAFMRLGTELGNARTMAPILLAPAAFGGEATRGTIRLAVVTLGGSQLTVEILKRITHRERPDGKEDTKNASFPSSHASAAATLAWIVGARHRRLAPWVWLVAVWIMASRVFLGRHFPSDVLAGALLGIWFAALALRFGQRLAAPRRVG